MKKIGLTLLYVFIALQIWANDKKKEVKTEIDKVTVFLNGAEINRFSNFQLAKGRTDIIVSGLSTQIYPKSIQAAISGNARILAISTETDFLKPHQNAKKIQVLQDSLFLIKDNLISLDNEIQNLDEQRAMILINKDRIGKDGNVSVAELFAAADFFEIRLNKISTKKFSLQKQIRKLNESKGRINQQLQHDRTLKQKPTNRIIIKVENQVSQKVKLDVSYAVTEAGWTPKYNIRAESIEKPIQFEYMANVFNNTAIDWKNIDLVLSTGDPFKSLTIPQLETWSLNYSRNRYRSNAQMNKGEGYLADKRMRQNSFNEKEFKQQETNFQNVEIEISEVSVNFNIKEKYSIPSDNKPYLVDVNSYEIPASYKYYTIPKLDCEAFLMANITDWEKINIIDSYANIYYGGKYIGESYISTEVANDTLAFSMGRDSKINISRVKKEDFNKKKWIGLNRTESFEYEISVRNTYNTSINIEVIDQVPISQESDIEVNVKEVSNAEHDEKTGRLKWNLTIEPKTTKKLLTAFSVKYPKNKKVGIRKKRKVSSPSKFW